MVQAFTAEGGNDVYVYDIRTGNKLFMVGGCNARLNDIAAFKDGSGVITSNEDGKTIIFRFEMSYYDDKWGN